MNLREIKFEGTQPTSPQTIENKQKKKCKRDLTNFAQQAYSCRVAQKILSVEEVIDRLRQKQGKRSDSEFADDLGISKSYLCDLYKGRRTPGDRILCHLGLIKRPSEPTYQAE